VFLWFIGTAILAVGFVFRDPGFDYRLLVVGSVLPLADGSTGGVGPLHSVTVSIALLAIVMISTRRGGAARRLLLGLPIGMLMHLVFDGAWADTDVFWWPFTGSSFADRGLPVVERGWWSLLLELVGAGLCVWIVRRNGLTSVDRLRPFLDDGHLDIAV
jgi:hypothetical protein